MDMEPKLEGRWVWAAPLGWRERHRVWRQGGRRVHRGWTSYDDVTPRWGCTTYRQDWIYPAGIEGDRIGSDAADLPLPPESVDGLNPALLLRALRGRP